MFTICWLIFWLLSGAPTTTEQNITAWAIALAVCFVIDVFKLGDA